jgi:DNA-binding PadR family transcriptional regulator
MGWGFDPGAGARGGRRGGWRAGRVFEQGDLKYVILQLLEEKPRHGYEIIKELEERSAGAYSPSPGTVYPTLTMLEDMGYARARTEESGKKVYEITDEGRAHLRENRSQVDDIFDRIAQFGASFFTAPMMEVNQAFKHLGWTVYAAAPRFARDAERVKRVKEILERAAKDVEEALRAEA